MREWSRREKAAMYGIAVVLLMVGGTGIWRYQQSSSSLRPSSFLEITPPLPGSVEITARGDDPDEPEGEAYPPPPPPRPAAPAPPLPEKLVVYVTGAVKRPGVYTMKRGDRLYNAVRAAGGFKDNAVKEALNIADFLRDGDQIHVPARQQPRSPTVTVPPAVRHAADPALSRASSAPPSSPAVTKPAPSPGRILGNPVPAARPGIPPPPPDSAGGGEPADEPARSSTPTKFKNPGDGAVNINTADAEELQKLPGIGPAMAQRILDYRQQIGGFKAPEQLMDVRGIGEKKFEKIKPFVRVG